MKRVPLVERIALYGPDDKALMRGRDVRGVEWAWYFRDDFPGADPPRVCDCCGDQIARGGLKAIWISKRGETTCTLCVFVPVNIEMTEYRESLIANEKARDLHQPRA